MKLSLIRHTKLYILELCHTEYHFSRLTHIYTPNGTQVSAIVYGELLSVEDKENYKNYVETFYSNCTFISEATTNYNCHSYAWYSQSTSNLVWLPNPSAYMTDGSYVYIGTSPTGASQKVYYAYPGNEHSGVVFYQPANTIISKWGQLPLMVHNVYDCPYFYIPLNPDNIKYYELDY